MSELDTLKELLVAAQKGDSQSYKIFLTKLYGWLDKILRRRISHSESREEALQNILIAVDKGFHTYDSSQSLAPWLNAIIRYKCYDEFRKIEHFDSLDENLSNEDSGLEETIISKDLIESSLEFLSEKERLVLVKTKIFGFSVEEVALEMGLSSANIKVITHRALKNLTHVLTKEES